MYGLLLYKEIETPQGRQRLEIYKDGFSGSSVEFAALHKDGISISKDSQSLTQAITTSVLTISLSDCGEVDYTQFFTPNSTLFKVVWLTKVGSAAWETRWTGFITPDSFTENLAYRDTLTLTARDNLGRLNDYDFDLSRGQMLSVRSILTQALAKAGVAMSLTVSTLKVASSPYTTLAVDGLVNTTLLQGMTWHEAVELLLTGLGLTLAWNDGNAFDLRDISQAPANSQAAFFISKSGYRQIRPAWKNLNIEQDYGLRENFYEGQFTKDDCGDNTTFTPPGSSKWEDSGSMALLNPYLGAAQPFETIFPPLGFDDTITDKLTYSHHIPTLRCGINLVFKCSNSYWGYAGLLRGIATAANLATQGGGMFQNVKYYGLRYRFNIFFTYNNTRYILREAWQEYKPATLEEPYLYFSMPGTKNGANQDQEIKFYIGGLPGSGTLEIEVYKPQAYYDEDDGSSSIVPSNRVRYGYGMITNIELNVDQSLNGISKNIEINANHNTQGQVAVRMGQIPESLGNNLLYLGGLFYDDEEDYPPLTAFSCAASATERDLLELVGREYLSYQNAAYNALSGQMMANAAFRFDKGIAFDSQSYRIVGASLAILSNTLQAQMLQQEATFDDDDYTITTVDSEGGSSTSGGGSSVPQGGGGGGSDRFFTAILDDDTGDTVGAKALYDLHIIQEEGEQGSGSGSGTPEVLKNITEILRHISLQVIGEGTASETTILVSDLTFASEGNLISGGVGGGGSTPTGGSIATLVDVTLSGLAGGDTLVYNATSSHWENKPLLLANLGDVSGTPSNGQTLVYDSTSGKWKPGSAASGSVSSVGLSMPTGFSVSGSPVTSDGTISVSFASGYSLPTTHKQDHWDSAYADSHTHSNKSVLDGISSSAVSHWDSAYSAMGKADYDSNGNALATQTWVTNKGYITSSAISDMATQTWVGQQGFLTSADLSGYATQSWVTGKGYITQAGVEAYLQDEGYATQTWVGQQGYITGVTVVSSDATIGTSLTTIGTVAGTAIKAKIDSYLLASSFTAANIVSTLGTTAVNRATADASGNTITSSYLRKDTDDIMAGNLQIGTASSKKVLTIRGTTTAAMVIYGGSSYTELYYDATNLHITSSAKVSGNITSTGNMTSGTSSDRRLKTDIRDINLDEAEKMLAALHPVAFKWNDLAGQLSDGALTGEARGFIADELLAQMPNAGRKIWDEYDALYYEQVIPYLVAGWQKQNLELRILRNENRLLREDMETLRRRAGL